MPRLEGFLLFYLRFFPKVNVLMCLGESSLPPAKPPFQKKLAIVLSMQSSWPWSPAGRKVGADRAEGGRLGETTLRPGWQRPDIAPGRHRVWPEMETGACTISSVVFRGPVCRGCACHPLLPGGTSRAINDCKRANKSHTYTQNW